jgi:hypothetical protein
MVLDVEMPMEDSLTEEQQEIVESAAVRYEFVVLHITDGGNVASPNGLSLLLSIVSSGQEMLYGLIHAR